jgi:hypothetical protein
VAQRDSYRRDQPSVADRGALPGVRGPMTAQLDGLEFE